MKAAAVAQEVFRREPNHPGAAHYILHAFDDPDHAILGVAAARRYATIAPAAPHALHMPSDIFLSGDAGSARTSAGDQAGSRVPRRTPPAGRQA
jgi:hypothetical protein